MNRTKGFTLIELLVVVGIIGLMSSLVLAAMTLARSKAQDAAVQREMTELRTLMAREMSDTGSYKNLKDGGGWKGAGGTCTVGSLSTQLKGTYANDAKKVCDALVKATAGCTTNCVYFQQSVPTTAGGGITQADVDSRFSIMAYLPGASRLAGSARYLCMGSSGSVSISNGATFTEAGCWQNP